MAAIQSSADCSRCTTVGSLAFPRTTSEFLFYRGSGWRSRSDIVNFGGRESDTGVVLLLHGNDPGSSIELLSEDLVSINESFKLSGQVVVLAEENARMSLECFFFLQLSIHVGAHIRVGDHLLLDVPFNDIAILVSLLDFDVSGSYLSTQIDIL